jgi:hypothetical protein
MPYTENLSLERVFTSAEVGDAFSYATISLADTLADSAQLQVRWELATVTNVSTGQPVATSSLTANERAQIFVLDPSYYSVNTATKVVTIDEPNLSNSQVLVIAPDKGAPVWYARPDFDVLNITNQFKLRRAINVSDAVVNFQSGSRLTAPQLNAAIQQLLFASQELAEFGTSSGVEIDVELGSESINGLGDVNINNGNTGAILVVGPTGIITDSTTGGVNEVLTVNAQTGNVVLNYSDVGSDPAGTIPTMSLDQLQNVDTTNLTPVDGDTLSYDGVDYAARRPVEIAEGTGGPPSAWTLASHRRVGDLYIRYEN